jgi:RNA polymerase sigma factor (sigma-70 family)
MDIDREMPLAAVFTPEQRFDAVMEQYGRLLRAAIARVCPRDMAADYDDIHQEACLRIWRAIASGREIPAPASYIYRVAATTTIDAIRRVKARREQPLEPLVSGSDTELDIPAPAHETPLSIAELTQLGEKTHRAIAAFPIHRRRAVSLHLQGLTTQEIAHLLGWSEAKARNLVYRTLKDLRVRLRADGIDHVRRRR